MYNVMLVDDEKLIVEGLKSIIDWKSIGLEVVNTARNGEEAINKFKKEPVDIIVTDVNMPIIDGLNLVKSIKEIDEKVSFIILSGYDDFSYAKTAISLGVDNYILKPVDELELEDALIKIAKSKSEKEKEWIKILDKNRRLLGVLSGKIDVNNIKENINIDLNAMTYSVASIVIDNENSRVFSDEIDDVLRKNILGSYEIVYEGEDNIYIINCWNENIDSEEVRRQYLLVLNELKQRINQDLSIVIGKMVNDINNIYDAMKSLRKVKRFILTEGYNKVITRCDLNKIKEEKYDFSKEIDKIKKMIIEKKSSNMKEYIMDLFKNYKLVPKNIYDLSIKILILIDKTYDEFNFDRKYEKDDLISTIINLCNERSSNNIINFLITEIDELIELMNPNVAKYSPVIQQIVKTVDEYYNEELSLKVLSSQYNINSSYLGQVFTKEVGTSFSEYLNKIKNEKAKELILNTNMKINDIAKEVGYADTSYFYRKFKKYYGVCPSTLRDIKNY